jgi:hypothetical protein
VLVALLAASVMMITPKHLARIDARYLMTVEEDNYTEISLRAFRIAQEGPKPFAVAMFGTSLMREAISDEAVIGQAASAGLGRPAAVYYLPAKALSIYEDVSLMDLVGRDFSGIVILQISPYQLLEGKKIGQVIIDSPRLAFHTPAEDDELRQSGLSVPARSGVYLLDNWRFCAARINPTLVRGLIVGPDTLPRHHYQEGDRLTAAQWPDRMRLIRSWWLPEDYDANRQATAARINRMAERLRRSGHVEIVLLEGLHNPDLDTEIFGPKTLDKHRNFVRGWADEQHFHYWDLQDEAGIVPADFHDEGHLQSRAAQQRYTETLGRHVRELASHWDAAATQPSTQASKP